MQRQVRQTISTIILELQKLQEFLLEFSNASPNGLPILRDHYTAVEAEETKERIEAAYQRGLISYDKKRGMKMVVTKSTDGWQPPRRRSWRSKPSKNKYGTDHGIVM